MKRKIVKISIVLYPVLQTFLIELALCFVTKNVNFD